MAYGYWSYWSVGLAVVHHPLMTSSGVPRGTTPIRTHFRIADVIGMLMVGVAPSYVIGMWYSDHYSDPYIIGIWYGGSTVYPTIVVLNLRWLRKEFSSHTYHQYDGTTIHGIHHRSRLIVVWWVPWYPRPRDHSTIGPRPNIIGLRRRPMYRATVAGKQRSFLVDPGPLLHAGINHLCSSLGTMIRAPRHGRWKGRLGLLSLGNSMAKLGRS